MRTEKGKERIALWRYHYFEHYLTSLPHHTTSLSSLHRFSASSEWPEKKYCSDTESFFLCELWKSFGARSLGRMVIGIRVDYCTNYSFIFRCFHCLLNCLFCTFFFCFGRNTLKLILIEFGSLFTVPSYKFYTSTYNRWSFTGIIDNCLH